MLNHLDDNWELGISIIAAEVARRKFNNIALATVITSCIVANGLLLQK